MNASEARALHSLLRTQPVAALATRHGDDPSVSMVPFAMLDDGGGFVIHVSRLAAHTPDLIEHPAVALLVVADAGPGDDPLARPRASIRGHAVGCDPQAAPAAHARARQCYLAKFPQAEPLFGFADFELFVIEPASLRYVAGFGRAMSLTPARLRALVSPPAQGAAAVDEASQ